MSEAKGQNDKRPNGKGAGPTRSFDGSAPGPGSQIGPFRIEQELGRGGAGVVYLAHDTKLDRPVAIKSLPAEIMGDRKTRLRFSREARVLASLNHPNIATIHDELEEAEGVVHLVLEYVPGQTLAERIAKKPLKLEEALSIALQIAEAVAAAHEHDVIHRDLKPGNIKITPEGKVKVLDFGLAKAVGGEATDQQSTVTEPGRVIGTPAYMSPEQARGKPTDKRSDIWSFGCVLYEMLTATVPFKGETISDTLANILDRDPDWQALPQSIPPNIRSLLRHHIGDARIEITETLSSLTASVATVERTQPAGLRRLIAAIACLVFVAVAASLVTWNLKRPSPLSQDQTRFVIRPMTTLGVRAVVYHHALAISPDGKYLAYVDEGEAGGRRLYLRDMDDIQARALPGTEGAISPFFSPDGEWIGFYDYAKKELEKIAVTGGTPTTLCKAQSFGGGSWGPDDTIIFARERHGLRRYTPSGEMEQLTIPDANQSEWGHIYPQVLPGGDAVLFTNRRGDKSRMEVLLLETGQRRILLEDGTTVRYVPTGHLVFVRNKTLYAVPFDLAKLKAKGTALPILESVRVGWGSGQYAFSENGTLVYVPAPSDKRSLVWVDRRGTVEPVGAPPRPYTSVRISPDGNRLAVTISHEKDIIWDEDIWIFDKARLTLRQLTFDRRSYGGMWMLDGERVIFTFTPEDWTLSVPMRTLADGSGKAEPLAEAKQLIEKGRLRGWSTRCLSPDGKYLLGGWNSIAVLPLDGEGDPWPFITMAHFQRRPRFSPDGRWVAYDSTETGPEEVYVRPFPEPGGITKISTEGGYEPIWSRDGKELFYRCGDKMMAVTIETEPEFKAGTPQELFKGQFQGTTSHIGLSYDIAPDGRFIMIQEDEESAKTRINVVLNWFEELKRLVPPGKKQ
ncbi:MAG: protein kinase domain-containing protein [Planctomycetota bacterium]|jgi:serine/threonine-protein kinase